MTSPEPSPSGQDLQFDFAQPATPERSPATCAGCRQPIQSYYYQVNGATICVPCREKLLVHLASGSRLLRSARAVVFGVLAGAAGTALYYGIMRISGYELGLIAIVVGVMVGGAVRAGCGGRGGWFYQVMAMVLAYASIAGMYVPMSYAEFEKAAIEDATRRIAAASSPAEAEAIAGRYDRDEAGNYRLRFVSQKIFVLVLALIASLVLPVLDFRPIGYLIKAFALSEAWKINRRPKVAISGPFAVAPAAAPGTGHAPTAIDDRPESGSMTS
jgi:hypothetical protein